MRRSLACVIFAASCARGGAEIIVVPTSSDIDSIALFVGVGGHSDTYLITSDDHTYPRISAWARDAYNEADVRTVTNGERVTFQFTDAPDDTLGVVIAVGYTAGMPVAAVAKRAVQVPHDAIARYELGLRTL